MFMFFFEVSMQELTLHYILCLSFASFLYKNCYVYYFGSYSLFVFFSCMHLLSMNKQGQSEPSLAVQSSYSLFISFCSSIKLNSLSFDVASYIFVSAIKIRNHNSIVSNDLHAGCQDLYAVVVSIL